MYSILKWMSTWDVGMISFCLVETVTSQSLGESEGTANVPGYEYRLIYLL